MTKIKIRYLNTEVTAHNYREELLVGICNDRIDGIKRRWIEDEFFKKSFNNLGIADSTFRELNGILDAMFFIDMVDEPISLLDLYQAIKAEVDAA